MQLDRVTLSGTIEGSGPATLLNSTTSTFSSGGRVAGTRTLLFSGTSSLAGTIQVCNDASVKVNGTTTVSAVTSLTTTGCPAIGAPKVAIDPTGTLVVNANLTTNLPFTNDGAVTIGTAQLDVPSYVQANGSTTLTAVGSTLRVNAGAGTATINGGTLSGNGTITGSLAGGGTISPGSGTAGKLTVSGAFTPSGTVSFAMAGTTPGVNMTTMQVNGTTTLSAASLDATFEVGFDPTSAVTFSLITPNQPVGTFTTVNAPSLFLPQYRPTGLVLTNSNCDTATYHPGVNLNGANLSGANLIGCNLSGANLNNADLSGANLTSANLTGASIAFTNLNSAVLNSATLTNANIAVSDLTNAVGINTVVGLVSTVANGWSYTNFDGTGLDLHGQNITSSGTHTALDHVTLSGANLSGANLTGANLNAAILFGTNLSSATLTGATMTSSNLFQSDLSSANLTNADVQFSSIDNANISGTTLTGTNLGSASGLPANSTLGLFSNTTCPPYVNSDDNGGNCEGIWYTGGE
jgi:uncharacterized protein YjbI with pentapeptide repeats